MIAEPVKRPSMDEPLEAPPSTSGASGVLEDNFVKKKRNLVDLDEFSTAAEVAEVLKLSTYTLALWRTQGKGPRYRKFGQAVRYERDDLIEWANCSLRTHTE